MPDWNLDYGLLKVPERFALYYGLHHFTSFQHLCFRKLSITFWYQDKSALEVCSNEMRYANLRLLSLLTTLPYKTFLFQRCLKIWRNWSRVWRFSLASLHAIAFLALAYFNDVFSSNVDSERLPTYIGFNDPKNCWLELYVFVQSMKLVGQNQAWSEADLPCNRDKNRYANIKPYDVSRVHLFPVEGKEGSNYINACWIPVSSVIAVTYHRHYVYVPGSVD